MMMNLSRKRSASPSQASTGGSPTLTATNATTGATGAGATGATQEELDQLTAMHILKRQRLAQAASEASLFRPSLMDTMNPTAGMSSLYNPSQGFGGMGMGMGMSPHMNAHMNAHMNMNAAHMSMNMNMNMNMNAPALFHPGATAARLRLAGATTPSTTAPLSPYYSPSSARGGAHVSGTISPMASTRTHPLAWRAAALNQSDCGMPVLPTIPHHTTAAAAAMGAMGGVGGFTAIDADARACSPSSVHGQDNASQDSSTTGGGLEQLSAFASHMPTMPVPQRPFRLTQRKASVDAPPSSSAATTTHTSSSASTNVSNAPHDQGELQFCTPINSKNTAAIPSPLPLKTMLNAKKLTKPVMDTAPKAKHWEDRPFVPLAINEDSNWLSEFQCFLRSEILEVFIASPRDLETRAVAGASKKKIASSQVGIRCRFCAHLHPTERASRASAFPSSVRQIYQSFTMMLREHLNGQCEAFPDDIKQHFLKLKGQSAQSASDSKRYWIYAAQKLGMIDTPDSGIQMNPLGAPDTTTLKPFGTSPELEADLKVALSEAETEPLALEADQPVTADFTFGVVRQAVRVHLAASEKIGNRSCLTVGLPGLACLHCAKAGRSGLSRVFPARKRNLKTKVHDLYDHLRRCDLTPDSVKEQLQQSLASDSDKKSKVFYARLWRRLGHENDDNNGGKSPMLESTPSSPTRGGNISPIPSSL